LKLPESLAGWLEAEAKRLNRSKSALIRELLEAFQEKRAGSAMDLTADLCGCAESGKADLSQNKSAAEGIRAMKSYSVRRVTRRTHPDLASGRFSGLQVVDHTPNSIMLAAFNYCVLPLNRCIVARFISRSVSRFLMSSRLSNWTLP